MNITIKQAPSIIMDIWKAGLVPMISSSPGVGKSSIIHQLAEENSLKVIDLRLSQLDPTDLSGLPTIKEGKTDFIPPAYFPLETDEIPKGYSGYCLFLDEFNSAPLAVQASSYKLVLDRAVGQHKLHKNVVIVCAGNLATDKAIVNRMSTAMQSRLIHLNLSVSLDDWLDWGGDIDYRIKGYLSFKPDNLHNFNPAHTDNTFSCPRTWDFLSKLIKDKPLETVPTALIAGTVGEGIAYEFKSFVELYGKLPKIETIISEPEKVNINVEPSTLYAMTSLVAHHIDKKNIDSLMKFIYRLPIEFQIITLRSAKAKDNSIIENKAVREWFKTHMDILV